MSSKSRKKSEEAPAKAPMEAPKRPSGRVPEAMVSSGNGAEMVTRTGRGFSISELSSAGLASRLASGWGIRIDVRRRSALGGNIESLKAWGRHQEVEKKPEGRVRKVEEKLVTIEREVKKEGAEVKAGAVKVEREVRREAAKAEKAVKAKVKKPKAKRKKKAAD